MLLDLAVEILHEIGGQLASLDHRNLRRVCKDLSVSMEPLVFSYLSLKVDELHLADSLQILETLATGETGWSQYVKTLWIRGSQMEQEEGSVARVIHSDSAMQELLVSALGSMTNVQTVIWDVDERDPAWQLTAICDFLGSLRLLDDLQLQVQGIVDVSLTRLSGLHILKIRTPYWDAAPIAQQVLHIIPQSPDLHSLELVGSTVWSEVWTVLRAMPDSGIRLKNICTNVVTSDLLSYLASYSGLEKLAFERPDGRDRADADQLADIFFGSVLPRHVKSLVEMSCPAGYDSRWSFGTHNVDLVSELHSVTSLEMSVDFGHWVDHRPSMASVQNLLRTSILLPALRSLMIRPTSVYGGCGRSNHGATIDHCTKTAIQNFRTPVESPVIVHASYISYQLEAVEVWEENCTRTAVGDILWRYRELPVST